MHSKNLIDVLKSKCNCFTILSTVVPAFNGPSDERTPAMSGHFLNVRTVLSC